MTMYHKTLYHDEVLAALEVLNIGKSSTHTHKYMGTLTGDL